MTGARDDFRLRVHPNLKARIAHYAATHPLRDSRGGEVRLSLNAAAVELIEAGLERAKEHAPEQSVTPGQLEAFSVDPP